MAARSRGSEAHLMQVPSDLASRLSNVAIACGRSPEVFLREAISRLIESTLETLAASGEVPQHAGFVPQPQGFSVYE
jgi:predicted transcriptional regulator